MPKANEIQPDKDISILFKSPPGYGKTLAALSLAVFGDVWIAYFDKKKPIEIFTYFHKIGRKDLLERITFETYTASNANKYLNDLDTICSKEAGRYVGLITDSATSLTTAAVNWSMSFRGKKSAIENTLAGSEKMIPGFDDYKVETNYAAQALDLTSGYPGFNIWTAHPLTSIDIKGGDGNKITGVSTKQSLVSYGNKVGQLIPGRFQEIYHFARQVDKRIAWTDANGEDFAKTCYAIPKSLDFTDKLFFEVWREAVNKSLQEMTKNEVNTNPTTQSKWKL